MGGGSSYSAGGPGKGMKSRLYQRILGKYEWAESVNSYTSIFSDTALFGLYGTAQPEAAGKLVDLFIKESLRMTDPIDPSELARGKNALKQSVLMQLESRVLQLEDIGRQTVMYGNVKSGRVICDEIDRVTSDDIRRIANKMLKTKPTIAAFGDCSYVPRYDVICQAFSK